MIGAIELGGTKTVVAIGNSDGTVHEELRFPTTHPEKTLGHAIQWFRTRGNLTALGVASFGPINVHPRKPNYGEFLQTPKPGWSGYSLVDPILAAFPGIKIMLDTDVNAAALAESRIGAAKGLEDLVYITVGTGIGGGIVSGGRLIHGSLHPEFGHLKVPRMDGDFYSGLCPFHRDCLEGMASGPAITARWGVLSKALPETHPAWEMEAWYLAHGILSLAAILSTSLVVVGGGIAQVPGIHDKINRVLLEVTNGYFPGLARGKFVVPPALDQRAGICGALLLTETGSPPP